MKRTAEFGVSGTFVTDTAFVLFFLALEYGRSVRMFRVDGILLAITMMMVLVLPYFLPSANEKPLFVNWVIGRGIIAIFGVLFGLAFQKGLGVVLPESIAFMPMTLLIVASMISCYIQFYSLFRLRLAK